MPLRSHTKHILAFAILTLIVFWGCMGNAFIDLDDDEYVTANPNVSRGLTSAGLQWAFTTFDYFYWQPLTWVSLQIDASLHGLNPWGFHLTNVALHTATALLVFYILFRFTNHPLASLAAAALYAWHPLRVESVAWIAERKDLLAAFFWFLTVACYERYAATASRRFYVATILGTVLGVASKPTVVTLPFALLLLDYWPLRRTQLGAKLIVEKLPLFALSALSSYLTFIGQSATGAVQTQYTLWQRTSTAIVAYARYLGKIVFPYPLAVQYPYEPDIAMPVVAACAALLLALAALVLWQLRARPYLAAGYFWFIGTLIPASGLIQVGWQSMADRHTYIPMFGIALAIAAFVATSGARLQVFLRASAVLAAVLAFLTYVQISYWKDSFTLFAHTLAVTENNELMEMQVGSLHLRQGRPKDAVPYLERVVKARPDYYLARVNFGLACARTGRQDDAVSNLEQALRIKPDSGEARVHLGMIRMAQSRPDDAARLLNEALTRQLKPEQASAAHTELGRYYAERNQLAEAEKHLREAIALEAGNVPAHRNLAQVLVDQGRIGDAIRHLNFAIPLTNGNRDLRQMLAALQSQLR